MPDTPATLTQHLEQLAALAADLHEYVEVRNPLWMARISDLTECLVEQAQVTLHCWRQMRAQQEEP